MKKIYLLILAISFLSSCRKGDEGASGDPGPGYYKVANGSVTSTIYYKYPNGDDAIVPGTYGAYVSETENVLHLDTASGVSFPCYNFDIIRYSSEDANDFVRISACGVSFDINQDTSFLAPSEINFGISRVSTGSTLFAFATMQDVYNSNDLDYYYEGENVTITNYYLNPVTHRLTFDYEISVSPYSIPEYYKWDTETYATIKGKVDVKLINSPYQLDVCGGNYEE